MGCSLSTLKEWKKKYPAISDALKKGKEVVDFEVENALLKSAMEGNTTAQIFWLKNRKKTKWRDRPEGSAGGGENQEDDPITKSIKEDLKHGILP